MPLTTNRQMLTWLCICVADPITSRWKQMLYIIFSFFLFSSNLSALVSSYVYFSKNVSTDLEEALYSLLQVAAFLGLTYMIITAILLRQKFTKFIDTLTEIYDTSATSQTFRFLVQANEKSEWAVKFYMRVVLGGFCANTITMAVASVLFCRLTHKTFELQNLYLPYRTTLPWNENTVAGYSAMILTHISFGETYLFSNGSLLLLFISICWYHRAFYEQFQDTLQKFDHQEQHKNAKSILYGLIHFHNLVKNWFFESSNVYSLIILTQLICSMAVLALTFFQLDLQLQHLDFSFTQLLIAAFASCANLFFYCYFGKLATESYGKMADCLFDSNWTELPVHLQKYFILMVLNTQRPLYYHGFGIAHMKLETFGAMIRNVITWYMMFKTISKQ